MMFLIATICLILTVMAKNGPQQVRLAATTEASSMVVQWATEEQCSNDNSVKYGSSPDTLSFITTGSCYNFTYGNPDGIHYLHSVTLTGLNERSLYYYQVISDTIPSDVFWFKTLSSDPKFLPNILYLGDLGHKGDATAHKLFTALPAMTEEIHKNRNIDMVIHAGDFAYDLKDDGGARGDKFFDNIQNISAYVPYMVCVGNHEDHYNYSHYRNRFRMPQTSDNEQYQNMWFSMDLGPMHLIFLTTECLFYDPTNHACDEQLEWIQNDLEKAAANRDVRPWLITIGHRPMYCSNADDDCIAKHSGGEAVRHYLEDLFFKYGVDIELWAHEHSYERTYPVYNFTVPQKNYMNPTAPVHLISGAAGCNESDGLCLNPILHSKGEWSAFRTKGIFHPYSYGHLRPYNTTAMYWDQINGQLKKVFDQIDIVQTKHGPFTTERF